MSAKEYIVLKRMLELYLKSLPLHVLPPHQDAIEGKNIPEGSVCSSRKLSERNHYGVIQVCKVNTTRNVNRRV